MATAEAVLDFFRRNEGLGENLGVNRNWITEWYGMTGAWCAMTVSRALFEAGGDSLGWITEAGISMTSAKGWAYVPYLRADFEAAGRFSRSDPQPGDVIIFDWDGDDEGDHTGVFERDLGDGTCLTWEGNTSDNDLSQRRRPYSLISGFCRPPYDQQEEEELDAEAKDYLRAIAENTGHINRRLTWLDEKTDLLLREATEGNDEVAELLARITEERKELQAGRVVTG